MKKINVILIILFLISLACFAFGCKVNRDVAKTEKTDTEYNLSKMESKQIDELINRTIETLFKQRLNITIRNTKYDTSQPVDSVTGLPPVAETNDINITADTEKEVKETEEKQTSEMSESISDETLSEVSETDIKETTEGGTGFVFPVSETVTLIVIVCLILIFFKWKQR